MILCLWEQHYTWLKKCEVQHSGGKPAPDGGGIGKGMSTDVSSMKNSIHGANCQLKAVAWLTTLYTTQNAPHSNPQRTQRKRAMEVGVVVGT